MTEASTSVRALAMQGAIKCSSLSLRGAAVVTTLVLVSLGMANIVSGNVVGWAAMGLSAGGLLMTFTWVYTLDETARSKEIKDIIATILGFSCLTAIGALGGVGVISGLSVGIGFFTTMGGYLALKLATTYCRKLEDN